MQQEREEKWRIIEELAKKRAETNHLTPPDIGESSNLSTNMSNRVAQICNNLIYYNSSIINN